MTSNDTVKSENPDNTKMVPYKVIPSMSVKSPLASPPTITFSKDAKCLGTLRFEDSGLSFTGNADASANVLFKICCTTFNAHIRDHVNRALEAQATDILNLLLVDLTPETPQDLELTTRHLWDKVRKHLFTKKAERGPVECLWDTANGEWIVAIWPDGTWSNWEDRHQFNHMSDDYEKHRVITFDPSGYVPIQTMRVAT